MNGYSTLSVRRISYLSARRHCFQAIVGSDSLRTSRLNSIRWEDGPPIVARSAKGMLLFIGNWQSDDGVLETKECLRTGNLRIEVLVC